MGAGSNSARTTSNVSPKSQHNTANFVSLASIAKAKTTEATTAAGTNGSTDSWRCATAKLASTKHAATIQSHARTARHDGERDSERCYSSTATTLSSTKTRHDAWTAPSRRTRKAGTPAKWRSSCK